MTADPIRWRCKGCGGWFGVAQAREVRGGEWRCAGCAASGRTDVDEPSELTAADRAWLRERHVPMPVPPGTGRTLCNACARSSPCPTVLALDENDRLRTALAAAANDLDNAADALEDTMGCAFNGCDDDQCLGVEVHQMAAKARAALGEGSA